jgi:hypothetical protein
MAIDLRLAQKLEAVGRLATGIAHEINTLIQYVGDSVGFLQSSVGDLKALLHAYHKAFHRLDRGRSVAEVPADLKRVEAQFDAQCLDCDMACERALEVVASVARIVAAMNEFAHPEQSKGDGSGSCHCARDRGGQARWQYLCAERSRSRDALPSETAIAERGTGRPE